MPSPLGIDSKNCRISRTFLALGDHSSQALLDRGGTWAGKGEGFAQGHMPDRRPLESIS